MTEMEVIQALGRLEELLAELREVKAAQLLYDLERAEEAPLIRPTIAATVGERNETLRKIVRAVITLQATLREIERVADGQRG